MNVIAVIPARYESSRFPGKPLQEINNKPMLWWAYTHAKSATMISDVYIATEDDRVKNKCDEYGMKCILTSKKHPTGTDRVGEMAKTISADYYLVLMGDEPMIVGAEIDGLVNCVINNNEIDAGMLATKFNNPVDVVNPSTIKLAINNNFDLIYISRTPIPHPKSSLSFNYFKNMGCYIFSKNALNFFLDTEAGYLEAIEEIEMLRLIENSKKVKVFVTDSNSVSVDTPKDLERVRGLMPLLNKN